MGETITLTLDSDLENSLLALSARGETIEDLAVRLLRDAVRHAATSGLTQRTLHHPAVEELVDSYRPDPSQMLPGGMTVGEYDSLTEEEEAALWNKQMEKELDRSEHEPECDVPPTALTPRHTERFEAQRVSIAHHLSRMAGGLPLPYRDAELPEVLAPQTALARLTP